MHERWHDLPISRLALASSYGAGAREVDMAFERGVTFFFWGAMRRAGFGAGLRSLASRHRDRIAVAIQTFASRPWMLRPSVEAARLRLRIDCVDVLCLAYRNAPIAPALLDGARALAQGGLVRSLIVSSHDHPTLLSLAAATDIDALMVRYNASHRRAAADVFPCAHASGQGIVAYTATRWGSLIGQASAADCYRFVLSQPAVSTCLFGPANEAELLEALRSLERGPMSPEELARMAQIGDVVRALKRSAPPLGVRDYARHAIEMARSVRAHGITEDLLSRFNR
jgi:aryl-alcohol dehydrogenase-like predicted oxidoreductase